MELKVEKLESTVNIKIKIDNRLIFVYYMSIRLN